MTGLLTGKVALVTGGSYGIGRATAETLAASGALVAIAQRPEDAADAAEVVAGIAAKGGQAFSIDAFLGPAGTAEALGHRFLDELTARLGTPVVDIIVNNVGGGGFGRIADTTNEYWDEIFDRNLRVAFFLVQTLLPHMRSGGSVINISSAAARLVNPDIQVYSFAKAAQNKLTQVLARELGAKGIRVNGIMPGFINTMVNQPFLSEPQNLQFVLDNTALGRLGEPQDIADVAHALATPAFRFVTGQVIEVGGGFSL